MFDRLIVALAVLTACDEDMTTGADTGGDVADSTTTTDTSTTSDTTADIDTTTATDTATGTIDVTSVSTAGVLCDFSQSTFNDSASVNATSTSQWTCNGTSRVLTANGLPDHEVGAFPNAGNPNKISAQTVSATYTLTPAVVSSTGTATARVGFALNGVKLDPGTAGTCDDSGNDCDLAMGSGTWRIEALGSSAFDFGTDDNNAHVQPGGAYHYHGMPEGYLDLLGKGEAMTLIGWAADGFPVYARYGYSVAGDASSGVKELSGSYQLKATPDANRPSTSVYEMGTFTQDWQYVAGSGDLDECNGRSGVTPEFPAGTYYYVITDSYPYIQRCTKGTAAGGGGGPPGGGLPGGGPPPGQ